MTFELISRILLLRQTATNKEVKEENKTKNTLLILYVFKKGGKHKRLCGFICKSLQEMYICIYVHIYILYTVYV